MTTKLTTTDRSQLEILAAEAYNGTREKDGMHRGFSAATIETEEGTLECRAVPSQSKTSTKGEWFSFRYYLKGKPIAKKLI